MRPVVFILLFFISFRSFSQRVELPIAKFTTGDNPEYSAPGFNDTNWPYFQSNSTWDNQGYSSYDGYAWYRFHFFVPDSLWQHSLWKDSLRFYIGKVDDACEVFLNGVKIGASGSFPGSKEGYITTWNKVLEFHVATASDYFKWRTENILAIRVYDGGGPGGIFGDMPYVNMVDLVDGLGIKNQLPVQYLPGNAAKKEISLHNSNKEAITGTLFYHVVDLESDKRSTDSVAVNLVAGADQPVSFAFKLTERNNIEYEFVEGRSHKSVKLQEVIPYILTPKVPETPRINGAKVFGARPNSPVLFKIPATGKKPLHYSIQDLPTGLSLDAVNGIISGVLKNKGDYKMNISVSNSMGAANREFTIQCGDILALTPPMGWNSWNCWGLSVSDEKVKASAQALIDKGLIDHGWTYMNIDDGWEAEARNDRGEIVTNKKFPDMKKLGDWLHGRGLKFGIYSSPGTKTCGNYLGSYQHEEQDAASYAGWGIDYLKYDWCSYEDVFRIEKDSSLFAFKKPYAIMEAALKNQSRDIVYSLCQYGMKEVWKWGADVNGNCWRTTGDIEDSWESLSGIGFNQLSQYMYAAPGRWNDPDMMIVGNVGWGEHLHPTRLTPDEQYTHVSLWCLLSAPLLIGCDLSKLDDFTLNLLTNDEVIAVDQDPLGKQARQVFRTENYQIWMKELEDGSKAIGLFNLSKKDDYIRFYWNDIGLSPKQKVRDLWRQKELGNFNAMFAAKLPAHGVILIKTNAVK